MLGLIVLIFVLWLSLKLVGLIFGIFGKLLGFLFSIAGYVILGFLAVGVIGLAALVIPIILIFAVIGIVKAFTRV